MKTKPGKVEGSGNVRQHLHPVDRCNQDCVAKLEELLNKAKSGEIIGVHGVAETPTTYFIFETRTLSKLATAGALLDAAVSRVRD